MKKVGAGITTRFSMQVVEIGCVAFRGCFNVVQDVAVTCLTTGNRIGLVALLPLQCIMDSQQCARKRLFHLEVLDDLGDFSQMLENCPVIVSKPFT